MTQSQPLPTPAPQRNHDMVALTQCTELLLRDDVGWTCVLARPWLQPAQRHDRYAIIPTPGRNCGGCFFIVLLGSANRKRVNTTGGEKSHKKYKKGNSSCGTIAKAPAPGRRAPHPVWMSLDRQQKPQRNPSRKFRFHQAAPIYPRNMLRGMLS